MMDDAIDQHAMLFGAIKDAMAPMHEATDALPKFRFRRPGQRMLAQQVERFVETEKVGVGCLSVELFDTESADFQKVGAGR